MADFTSYDQIVKWIAKGRLGFRKKRSFSFRMQEDVVIMSQSARYYLKKPDGNWDFDRTEWRHFDFAELRPGDVITFTRDPQEMREIAVSMSSTFWKVLGICWTRVGTGRYSMFHYDDENGKSLYWQNRNDNTKKYEFFKGMAWEFARGICINPRKPILKQVDKEKRRTWCADLKRFKRAFDTRLKIGVVDAVIAEYEAGGMSRGTVCATGVDDAVLDAITTGVVTTDFIKHIVSYRATTGWRPVLSANSVRATLGNIINRNSVRYRQEYGVLQK